MAKTQILVVEDEIIIAEDIRRSLQRLGYEVPSVVSSGEDAIKKAEENEPDLVLMDIVLRGRMDGIEAAEQIHSRFGIPLVYLTAYADEATLERAKITEPFGYIIKPFRERELHVAIEIALFKHKIEKELKESREWFFITLRSISDAVIATDPNGYVLFMNPAAESIMMWKMEEAKGLPLKRVLNIVTDEANRTVLIAQDGARNSVDTSSDAIKDDKGNIIGIVVVLHQKDGE